jgi:hypothetical protein
MKRQISHSGRIQSRDRVIKAKDSTSERYQSGVHVNISCMISCRHGAEGWAVNTAETPYGNPSK